MEPRPKLDKMVDSNESATDVEDKIYPSSSFMRKLRSTHGGCRGETKPNGADGVGIEIVY